jgi:uncharacterized protein YbbK (DUF523 family)
VLVSACLLGQPVRYDGGARACRHPVLARWVAEGRVVPFCPEMAAGMTAPRPAAEISAGADGADVLAGQAKVLDADGEDLTAWFIAGARLALERAMVAGARVAVLKEGSPSCGTRVIGDGTFSSTRKPGTGVAAALLARAGIRAFSEDQLEEADVF